MWLWALLFAAWSVLCVQSGDINITATHEGRGSSISSRPVIYTYFERIDASNRTTGMTDEEDANLLGFWEESWEKAGYTPVILTAEDVNHPTFPNATSTPADKDSRSFAKERFELIRSKLDALPLDDFGKLLFRRWMAMAAVGGGWFSDYDNFPLWDRLHRDGKHMELQMPQGDLPNGGKMTVYDILSPTLASGSANEWLDTLEALLDDVIQHCPARTINSNGKRDFHCFYTDSLGIHSLKADHHPMAPKTTRKVALPFDKNDPVSFHDPDLCSSRDFRTKSTVHFGPEALQRGKHVPPNHRLPKHRFPLAQDWLDRWQRLCHKNEDSEHDATDTAGLSLSNQ